MSGGLTNDLAADRHIRVADAAPTRDCIQANQGEEVRSLPAVGPCIYGLYDRGGNLRYIGKANDPAKRLSSHMRDARRRHTPLYNWIRKHGKPAMRVLEAGCEDWLEAERRLIAEARARGEKLLNLASGGDEPFCSPAIRSENGKRLVQLLKDNPAMARFRYCRRQLAVALRNDAVMNITREKMRKAAAQRPGLFGDWLHIPDREELPDGSPVGGY